VLRQPPELKAKNTGLTLVSVNRDAPVAPRGDTGLPCR
jgi:hypothetical protein